VKNWLIEGNVTFGTVSQFPLPSGEGTTVGRPFPLFRARRDPQCPDPAPVLIQAAWKRTINGGTGLPPNMLTDGVKLLVTWGNGNAKYGPVKLDFIAQSTLIPISACDAVDVEYLNESNVADSKAAAPGVADEIRVSLADCQAPNTGPGGANIVAPTLTQRFEGVLAAATTVITVPPFAQGVMLIPTVPAHAAATDWRVLNGNATIINLGRVFGLAALVASNVGRAFDILPAGAASFSWVNADPAPRDFVVIWKMQL